VAEATASLLKLVSGRLADRGFGSKRLVLGGYALSNGARPLIGLAPGWGAVLALRFLDRVGKGVRTAPRDALIAAATGEGRRGAAFGFQRALDHAGAMVGPLVAFALLQREVPLRDVFLWSVVPGAIVLALLAFALPGDAPAAPSAPPPPLRWGALDRRVRALVLGAGALALATAPEAFLVLWASERGLALAWVPLLWAAAHGAKALVAGPAGALADRFGRLRVVAVGWAARVAVLAALALAGDGPLVVWGLFIAFAIALAATEGAERALVGDLAPPEQRATAFGVYHLVIGLLALPGGLLFGGLWQGFGAPVAFTTAAAGTALAAGALVAIAGRRAPA
jgi:MFS family permease